MPQPLNMPSSGFQAVILCGPGVSLTTFTANPDEFPKALVPIANRPMVWYPLDWCYRMGITCKRMVLSLSSSVYKIQQSVLVPSLRQRYFIITSRHNFHRHKK